MSTAAYVFDAYGTLFDVHAAVRRHAERAGPEHQRFSEMWRAKQLEYSWVRTLMGSYRDFWQLTEEALDYTLKRFPSVERSLRADLLSAYWTLDCYPEVPAVLKELKGRGAKLAILSNGSPQMLDAAVKNAALDMVLDDVFLGRRHPRLQDRAPGLRHGDDRLPPLSGCRLLPVVQSLGCRRRAEIRFPHGGSTASTCRTSMATTGRTSSCPTSRASDGLRSTAPSRHRHPGI